MVPVFIHGILHDMLVTIKLTCLNKLNFFNSIQRQQFTPGGGGVGQQED